MNKNLFILATSIVVTILIYVKTYNTGIKNSNCIPVYKNSILHLDCNLNENDKTFKVVLEYGEKLENIIDIYEFESLNFTYSKRLDYIIDDPIRIFIEIGDEHKEYVYSNKSVIALK
jgi:hypothetical protein